MIQHVRRAIPEKTKRAALARDGWLCALCKRPVGCRIEYDHRIPVALGGGNEPANVRPMHPTCHKRKTAADVKAIRKADRQRLHHETGSSSAKKRRRKIPSQGFPKWKPERGVRL